MRILYSCIIILTVLTSVRCQKEQKDETRTAENIVKKFYALNDDFDSPKDVWGGYTLDLTFEAMLAYEKASGEVQYLDSILKIMKLRGQKPSDTIAYHSQPFGNITFALFEASGDSSYLQPFLYETERMFNETPRSEKGAVLHKYNGKKGLLIDYVQEYASRMAKAGSVTGNEVYFEEAVRQFEMYDSIVRDKETGLYRQGIGFLEDENELSPNAWSRGQGWILRGLVSTMTYLPENSEYIDRMQTLLTPFVDSLIVRQNSNGLWHQLVDLPFDESYAEITGTGFIAYYLAVAINHNYLAKEEYSDVVLKAVDGIKNQIDENYSLQNGCPGPGPIVSIDNWYKKPGITNEPHSFATTIYALAGEQILLKNE